MVIAFVGTLAKMAKGNFVGIDSFSYGSISTILCFKTVLLINGEVLLIDSGHFQNAWHTLEIVQ